MNTRVKYRVASIGNGHCAVFDSRFASSTTLVCAMGMMFAATVEAEQVYVSDKLVANITDQASQDGKKVTTVESGDVLEVLERAEGYVSVRTEKGNEGWIKSNYVTAQMPAARRLKELEAQSSSLGNSTANVTKYTLEISQLQERVKALDGELVASRKAADEARAIAAASVAQSSIEQSTASATSAEVLTSISTTESAPSNAVAAPKRWSTTLMGFVAVSYLVVGALGFIWGYKTFSAKIRRKYGRVKIL